MTSKQQQTIFYLMGVLEMVAGHNDEAIPIEYVKQMAAEALETVKQNQNEWSQPQ